MKGVVFTEFIELVEETYSMDMVDDIIDSFAIGIGYIAREIDRLDLS